MQQRIRWVLNNLYRGNQSHMAAAMGMSQSLISRVANGRQGAGPEFLDALKRLPGLNPNWVDSGEGEPLLPPTRGTLPIARGILPGEPAAYPELQTGERHPVAEAFERPSRYWVRLLPGAKVLQIREVALLSGDLLLFEADRAVWEGRLNEYTGQLCGVSISKSGMVNYEIGLLRQAVNEVKVELIGASEDVRPQKSTSLLGNTHRSIVIGSTDPDNPAGSDLTTPALEETTIVAVQVYLARPHS
jgi:hypothetical protein